MRARGAGPERRTGQRAPALPALALLAAVLSTGTAAQAPPACSAPQFAQFDFWLGDWTVRWTDAEGREHSGTNRIRKTHGGCVIVEQFDGRPGTPLQGTSVSAYVPDAGQWKQTWVDNQGSYLDFAGGLADGRMVLARRDPHSGKRQRMIFSDIGADSLTWDWQLSADDGATWRTAWRLHYARRP